MVRLLIFFLWLSEAVMGQNHQPDLTAVVSSFSDLKSLTDHNDARTPDPREERHHREAPLSGGEGRAAAMA